MLGNRTNELIKGEWVTPGGQIYKNETWQNALLRIAEVELGLSGMAVEDFSLMGMWDHFYTNSTFDENTSTHYVNLPHFACFENIPLIVLDDQHVEFDWFDLQLVSTDEKFHPYIKNYAEWLIKKLEETDD